jgi:tyrosyl-tRNA synthetase
MDFLDELAWRGRIAQITDESALRRHLETGKRRAYIGFDPTADSLTVGNLVQILTLALFQRAGHTPVVIAGGGTGLIGDPSGKETERQLRSPEEVAANVESQKRIFERILDFSPGVSNRAIILNNLDWLGRLSYIEVLRDIGKHFSVNMMIQKESVRERLHGRDQGISYTEFSYMILQAFDFLHLYERHGVTIQMGGSDQWGNIVCGVDLIRRKHTPQEGQTLDAFGLTTHLITKADGTKFGKTESGALWLTPPAPGDTSPNRTSPYAFYQFWLNTADADVPRFLRAFTLLPYEEIQCLEAAHLADPGKREAHRALARHMTEMLHGPTEMARAEAAAKALFSGEIASLPPDILREALASAPTSHHDKTLLSQGVPLVDLLVSTGLAHSKREAREFLQNGSVTINGRRALPDDKATTADLLHGEVIALRRGKKAWHVTRWQ